MRKLLFFFLLAVLMAAMPALAQEATVVGTVTDNTGAALPNATITLTNMETSVTRTLTSNEAGQYVAGALHIGPYTIKAEAKGFTTQETKGLVLQVGDRTRVDFALKVGGATESITVEANPIAIKTETAEIASTINTTQITQLQTNGRSLYALVNLTPGASSLQQDFQVPTPMGGDQNVAFNGQRVSHNLYMIDGAEAADRGGSGAIVQPSIDALAEFKALTSNYSAEYGMSSSGTISTVLRSGTKSLHASAWWLGRNDYFNARNFFRPEYNKQGQFQRAPKERFNLWGFNVGGPVIFKKTDNPKTFFFYNMEWRRRIQGANLSTGVPFPNSYGGDLNEAITFSQNSPSSSLFRNSTTTNPITLRTPCANQVSAAVATRFANAGVPLSTCDASGNTITAGVFPNNTIPGSLQDANAVALLRAGIFPAPNVGNRYTVPVDAPTNVKEELVRMDHTFNDKFSVFGHFIAEQIMQTDIPTRWSGGANVPSVYDTFGNPSYSAVVHAAHIISPSLLNEVAFNYGGNRINIQPQGIYSLTQTGFSQNKLFGFKSDITPIIALNGKTGSRYDANWSPWNNTADSYQIRDDLSWTKGNHQLKFGAGWLNFRKLQPLQVGAQGTFTFGGGFTNYDFADFLLGLSGAYTEPALKDDRQWNSTSWFGYAQDNWRATRRLTLNLGLRWDGMPHTAEVNGQMSNFVPSLYDPAMAPAVGTFVDGAFVPAPGGFANANGTQICSGVNVPLGSGCTVANGALATGPNPQLNGLLQYANGLAVPGQTPGVGNGLVRNHWLNLGPRIGFAYDLTGQGKTVVRGGFGMMFERVQGNDMYQVGGNNLFGGAVTINNVSLSNPHVGVDQTNTTISSSVLPVTVNNIAGLDPNNYKNPTSYQYSAGVQQQLTKETVLSVSYVGNQNRFLSTRREINLPDASLVGTLVNGSTAAARYNTLVPYKGYRSVNIEQNDANSIYNSLQIEVRSKMKDLQIQGAYTLSRAEDPTTGTGGNGFDLNNVSNPWLGWKYDWGPSIFDKTHVAFVNFIYDVPFFRHSGKAMKTTLGGWQLSGIVSVSSGAPINLAVGTANVCGTIPNCIVRPNQIGPVSYPKTPTTINGANGLDSIQWFDPSAFEPNYIPGTTTATFGNTPHNSLRGPGRNNWNMAIFKNFAFTERARLELRMEANNVWNHTQFRADVNNGGINNAVGGSDVGKITQAWDPRTLQFGLKLIF